VPRSVAELIYGPDVGWYRSGVDAGSCVVIHHRVEYLIDAVEPYGTAAGTSRLPVPVPEHPHAPAAH